MADSTGAQAVADAVKRVADAAVHAVQATSPVPVGDFIFTGTVGGRFTIRGEGFGPSGTVKIGGHQAKTHGWSTREIFGWVPEGANPGAPVEVIVDDKNIRRGTWR